MPVHTVLGEIDPADLGATSMHEHCLLDATVWRAPGADESPDRRVTTEGLGALRWNYFGVADNLQLDDPELAIEELHPVAAAGGSGIVELTVNGLGPRVDELREIARRTGLHIMVGCGLYVEASHPEWARTMSVDDLTTLLVRELREGIGLTNIKPALIGEIGTSDPPTERELGVLEAAGRAASLTGAAVNVHLEPVEGRNGLMVVSRLLAEGVPADRIVLSHLDAFNQLDFDYHVALAETGAILEYDNFGLEHYAYHSGSLRRNRTDLERMECLARLVHAGYESQLVLGCDVYTKGQLRRYGGTGYDHLLTRIVPTLEGQFAVPRSAIEKMLVQTPRRLLNRPALEPPARSAVSKASRSS